MALIDYLAEGTAGTNVATSTIISTPAGYQASSVSAGTGNPAHVFSDEQAQSGATSIKMVTAATTAGIVRLPFAGTAATQGAVTFSHYSVTAPTALLNIANIRTSSGSPLRIGVNAARAVTVASSTATLAQTADGAWATGRQNHIQVWVNLATGDVSVSVFAGTSRVPTGTLSGNYSLGATGTLSAVDVGTPQNAPTGGYTHYFDTIRLDDGRTSQIPFLLPASSGDVRPIPGAGSGASGWTVFGGAADEGTALSDSDAGTGVESPDITSTATERIYPLAAMTARSTLTLTLTGVQLTTGTATCQVKVYQGSTVIATKSLTATTTATDRTVSLTSPEVAAITDWTDLRVGIRAVL